MVGEAWLGHRGNQLSRKRSRYLKSLPINRGKPKLAYKKFLENTKIKYQRYIYKFYKQMHYQLTQANLKLKEAESKTDLKEAEMKRALMRGVCALNMEAMSVFRDKTIVPDLPKEKQVTQNSSDQSFEAHVIPEDNYQKTFQYTGNMKKNQDTKITRVLVTRHQ
jgi:hypothetical protein